jgi:hypothetical protein
VRFISLGSKNAFESLYSLTFLCFLLYGLSVYVGKITRQIHLTDKTKAIAQLFLARVARAYTQYGSSRVFTMDETFWPLLPNQSTHIQIRGRPRSSTVVDNKAGLSLVVTVAADGSKPPLFVVAKGKTMRCTEKFAVPPPHGIFYSESGWMRNTVMPAYMEHVLLPVTRDSPCALILDVHSSHTHEATREYANAHNIELLFVPACMTATLAPLDVGVNGVLKAVYKRKWRRERLFGDADEVVLPLDRAVASAVNAYRNITGGMIRKAFHDAVQLPTTMSALEALAHEADFIRRYGHIEEEAEERKSDPDYRLPAASASSSSSASSSVSPPRRSSARRSAVCGDDDENDAAIAEALSYVEMFD